MDSDLFFPITVLPSLGGRCQFAEKELASWWLPSSLGLALFSRMDNFFFLGFISVKMNSFSNSREVCINRSVTHGSKLQKLARSRGAVLVVTHKPCERRNKISREQSEVWRQKAFNASVIHCSFSGCGR